MATPLAEGGFVTRWRVGDRVVVGAGPIVELPGKARRGVSASSRVTGPEGPWELRLGCDGPCTLFVDGVAVLEKRAKTSAWIDDQELTVSGRGERELRVQLAKGKRRFVLRVVDPVAEALPPGAPARPRRAAFACGEATPPGATAPRKPSRGGDDAARAVALVTRLPVAVERVADGQGARLRVVVGPAPAGPEWAEVRVGDLAAAKTRGERVVLEVALAPRVEVTLAGAGISRREAFESALGRRGALEALAETRGATGDAVPEASVRWWREELLRRMGGRDAQLVDDAVEELRAAFADLDPRAFARRRGVVIRAYVSKLDGRPQPFASYLPEGDLRDRSLVVALHPSGYSPLRTLRGALGLGSSVVPGRSRATLQGDVQTLRRDLGRRPAGEPVVVAPWGYGGTGSRWFGKVDVLEVLELTHRLFQTDRHAVRLTGGSLGGLGTWQVGLRHPDLFAELWPIAGYGSVRLYPNVRGVRRAPWEPFLLERRDNVAFVDNAHDLPMRCVHGELDGPRRSEVVVERYAELRYPHTFECLAGVGHAAWDAAWESDVLPRRRSAGAPRRTVLVSGSYRHASAYGVRIDQFRDHGALGRVEVYRGEQWRVVTKNVQGLTLTGRASDVVVDGVRLGGFEGQLHVRAGQRVARASVPAGEKRAGVAGPPDDIRYGPHVFVYGTQRPAELDTNLRLAEHLARYRWHDADIAFPVVPDTAVDEAMIRSKDLVLIGSRASNRVLDRLADRLPVRLDADAIWVRGHRYAGPAVGALFVAPNPDAPDRMVVVRTGTGRRGVWLSSFLPDLLPDFVVFDEGVAVERGGYLMGPRRPLVAGNFDTMWR